MKKSTASQQAMSAELMSVYNEVVRTHDCRGQYAAYELTVSHPASRFYVTPKAAYKNIYPLLRGDYSEFDKLTELKQQMYRDLLEVTLELSRRREFCGKSPHYILQFAVTRPAPRFYITAKRMSCIYTRERRKRRCAIMS